MAKRTAIVILATMLAATQAAAQTSSARDTATAYGARLASPGQPAGLNQRRVNSRVASRINNRLSLRIERYRPDAAVDPAAGFRATPDDGTRNTPVTAPPPPQDLYAPR